MPPPDPKTLKRGQLITATATDLRKHFARYLELIQYLGVHIMVTSHGKERGVFVPPDWLERHVLVEDAGDDQRPPT